jgi:photosystem II stability/assembly factor-like uncharacterized protein
VLLLSHVARAESVIVNVSSGFRPGPYSTLKVDAANAERIAISTPDGYVLMTEDGGGVVAEAKVISERVYFPMVLRGMGAAKSQFGRASGRGANRLFISLLHAGIQSTRWASWMATEDPVTEIFDVAMAPKSGRMIAASPSGLFVSDRGHGVWFRVIGGPRPKGNQLWGLSSAFDPGNPSHVLAGTNEGLMVSDDGGYTFHRHPDKKLAEEQIRQFIWDGKDPNTIFALTGEAVLKSEDRGASFAGVLQAPGDLNALVPAEDGVYLATSKGLYIYGSESTSTRFKDEAVVGVVPLGKGAALVATDKDLYVSEAEGRRPLMHTNPGDPFVKLAGTPELAWAITKYCVFRIGAKEARAEGRRPAPKLKLSLDEVQWAVIKHLGVGTPQDSRLNDRWFAALMPTVVVEVAGVAEHGNTLAFDGTFPVRYRSAQGTNTAYCCGAFGTGNPSALVWARWDLAKLIPYGNVTMPFGLVESGLRNFRVKILEEVRWRYRELRDLLSRFARPPDDAKTALFQRMRAEELKAYLEAMSGREVLAPGEMEELHERDD